VPGSVPNYDSILSNIQNELNTIQTRLSAGAQETVDATASGVTTASGVATEPSQEEIDSRNRWQESQIGRLSPGQRILEARRQQQEQEEREREERMRANRERQLTPEYQLRVQERQQQQQERANARMEEMRQRQQQESEYRNIINSLNNTIRNIYSSKPFLAQIIQSIPQNLQLTFFNLINPSDVTYRSIRIDFLNSFINFLNNANENTTVSELVTLINSFVPPQAEQTIPEQPIEGFTNLSKKVYQDFTSKFNLTPFEYAPVL
jgi:hypothetical protein